MDWREELINAPLTTCIQTASLHSSPLQLCLPVLDKKLCVLNFLPVERNNAAYNKMLYSDRTAQLEDQHDERSEDRIAKTMHLFIDGEFDKAKHAPSYIANMLIFLTWMYENGRDTFWGKQLLGIFNLLVSDAGKAWFDYIVDTHPHTPFNIIMECQVVVQAIHINMVQNKSYPQHIEKGLEIPFDGSLGRAQNTCLLPQNNISMAVAGSNHQLSSPHQLFANMSLRGSLPFQRSNANNTHQGKGQQQRGDQNNGNNRNGNGNRNNCDNRNNNDQHTPAANNRGTGPIGGDMTEERKTQLKGFGFLVATGRYVRFVHEFSGFDKKQMCNYFAYRGHTSTKTDDGTYNFAHIRSFNRLPTSDKNALKEWVRDTRSISFVEGQGPTNFG